MRDAHDDAPRRDREGARLRHRVRRSEEHELSRGHRDAALGHMVERRGVVRGCRGKHGDLDGHRGVARGADAHHAAREGEPIVDGRGVPGVAEHVGAAAVAQQEMVEVGEDLERLRCSRRRAHRWRRGLRRPNLGVALLCLLGDQLVVLRAGLRRVREGLLAGLTGGPDAPEAHREGRAPEVDLPELARRSFDELEPTCHASSCVAATVASFDVGTQRGRSVQRWHARGTPGDAARYGSRRPLRLRSRRLVPPSRLGSNGAEVQGDGGNRQPKCVRGTNTRRDRARRPDRRRCQKATSPVFSSTNSQVQSTARISAHES